MHRTPGGLSAVRAFLRSARPRLPARIALAALFVLLSAPAAAQTPPTLTAAQRAMQAAPEGAARVAEIRFRGPLVLPEATLRLALRTRENRRFLGIRGATWWLWLYNAGENRRLGRVGRALAAAGEPPAVADAAIIAADAERLALVLRQEGYRRARVAVAVDTVRAGRVRVTFRLDPGPAARVRRVLLDVAGPDSLGADEAAEVFGGSLLAPVPGSAHAGVIGGRSGTAFAPALDRYSESLLAAERRRLLADLRERGFAAVNRDSIRVLVFPIARDARPGPAAADTSAPDTSASDTLARDSFGTALGGVPRTDSLALSSEPLGSSAAAPGVPADGGDRFDLVLRVRPGARYRFGSVDARVTGPERTTRTRVGRRGEAPADLVVTQRGERKLRTRLVARSLRAEPGARYRASDLAETKRRLDATGVFSFTDVAPRWDDTVRVGGALYLPHRLDLRTRPRHAIRAESFVLQRSGVLENADGQLLGTGLGVTYENANVFGSGEALTLRASGTVSTDLDARLFASSEAEVSATLAYPYLTAFGLPPLRGVRAAADRLAPRGARTLLALSFLAARRAELYLVIRGRGTARIRYELQHTRALTSILDVADVSLSNPDTLVSFRRNFLARLDSSGSDPVEVERVLEDYTRPQVNTAIRYTLRSQTAHPIRRDAGHTYEASLAAGGYLEALLDRFAFSPDTLGGTLPGLGGGRLVYRPHVRATFDARRYRPLSARTVFAFKAAGGVALATGASGLVPFDQRFYAGGGSSVRGWGLRELGPGAAGLASGNVRNVVGGDVRVETSAELRYTVFPQALSADWIAAGFVDAGNVWLGPRNPSLAGAPRGLDGRFRAPDFVEELAVGAGVGMRIAWPYIVVRLDVAARVLDPARSGLLPDGLRSPTLHFGLGHAF